MQTCQGAYRVKEARVFWNTAREFESPRGLYALGTARTRVGDLHHAICIGERGKDARNRDWGVPL